MRPGSPATVSCRAPPSASSSATCTSAGSRSWIRRRSAPAGSRPVRRSMRSTSSDRLIYGGGGPSAHRSGPRTPRTHDDEDPKMSSEFPTTDDIAADVARALAAVGVDIAAVTGDTEVRTPITGGVIFSVATQSGPQIDAAVAAAAEAFKTWRDVPAPIRGQLVKRWGELLTEHKTDLATLVTAEVGKIRSEALGEVQEMIDIADLAVGQSRQLFGKTMPS